MKRIGKQTAISKGLRIRVFAAALVITVFVAGVFAFSSTEAGTNRTSFQIPPRPFPDEVPSRIFGLPASPEAISVLPFAGRWVLWLPVLMDESSVPVEAVLLDPLQWDHKGEAQVTVGRRSLWFMEPGMTMLYGVIIDPASLEFDDVGVAYVVLNRLDEERYDVLVEDTEGNVLVAARGTHHKIDESIGAGTLIPADDAEQQLVREEYGAQWPVGPEALFLFGIPNN